MNVFAQELETRRKKNLQTDDIFDAVTAVMGRCRGAYAVVVSHDYCPHASGGMFG